MDKPEAGVKKSDSPTAQPWSFHPCAHGANVTGIREVFTRSSFGSSGTCPAAGGSHGDRLIERHHPEPMSQEERLHNRRIERLAGLRLLPLRTCASRSACASAGTSMPWPCSRAAFASRMSFWIFQSTLVSSTKIIRPRAPASSGPPRRCESHFRRPSRNKRADLARCGALHGRTPEAPRGRRAPPARCPRVSRRNRRVEHDPHAELLDPVGMKGCLPGKQLMEDDAHRPYVAPSVNLRRRAHLLRRHRQGRSERLPIRGELDVLAKHLHAR